MRVFDEEEVELWVSPSRESRSARTLVYARRYPNFTETDMLCRHVALALGWVAFAFVLQRALQYESPVTFYDPYKILGISTVSRC
jgi:preprotein translocase subunit Sec63